MMFDMLEKGPYGLTGVVFYGYVYMRELPLTIDPPNDAARHAAARTSGYVRVWDARGRVVAGGTISRDGDKDRAHEWLFDICAAKWGDAQ